MIRNLPQLWSLLAHSSRKFLGGWLIKIISRKVLGVVSIKVRQFIPFIILSTISKIFRLLVRAFTSQSLGYKLESLPFYFDLRRWVISLALKNASRSLDAFLVVLWTEYLVPKSELTSLSFFEQLFTYPPHNYITVTTGSLVSKLSAEGC